MEVGAFHVIRKTNHNIPFIISFTSNLYTLPLPLPKIYIQVCYIMCERPPPIWKYHHKKNEISSILDGDLFLSSKAYTACPYSCCWRVHWSCQRYSPVVTSCYSQWQCTTTKGADKLPLCSLYCTAKPSSCSHASIAPWGTLFRCYSCHEAFRLCAVRCSYMWMYSMFLCTFSVQGYCCSGGNLFAICTCNYSCKVK